MADPDLSAYSDTPLFNTKAAVQGTGVPAATLRAWERRYGVPDPVRTEKNYRLYSERDLALIRWLRDRVEAGLTISQAVELYRRMREGEALAAPIPGEMPATVPGGARDSQSSRHRLLDAFTAFDEPRADRILDELFALFSIEEVLTRIVRPAMIEIGEMWRAGKITVATEHFATAYVVRKLMALMNVQPTNPNAPLIVTGCAPHEHHELGILFFSLFLRRNGLRVLYLGRNVPRADLRAALETLRPAMLAMSAATRGAALELAAIGKIVQGMATPRPLFVFGGAAFRDAPSLIERVPGHYMGEDARDAARHVPTRLRG